MGNDGIAGKRKFSVSHHIFPFPLFSLTLWSGRDPPLIKSANQIYTKNNFLPG